MVKKMRFSLAMVCLFSIRESTLHNLAIQHSFLICSCNAAEIRAARHCCRGTRCVGIFDLLYLRGGISSSEEDSLSESKSRSLDSSSKSRSDSEPEQPSLQYESESESGEQGCADNEPRLISRGRNGRLLTDDEVDQIIAEWDNDTQWANATLPPLLFGDPTPEEIHWEEERLHGDLNVFRHTGQPSAKWREWRAAEDARAAAQVAAQQAALRSAEELPLPSEWSDDAEPNWSLPPPLAA